MTRPSPAAAVLAELARAHADAAEYRKLVLAEKDLAARLTARPLEFKQPEQWNGYIPPYMIPADQGHARNDSAQRVHLVAIVREAMARNYGEDVARAWLEDINANHWPREGWSPHDALRHAAEKADREVPTWIKEQS
jgi:hypothetical protein